MTRKIILSLDQARTLQAEHKAALQTDPMTLPGYWGSWTRVMSVEVPEVPDNIQDLERVLAGVEMARKGCTDEAIAETLGWKYPGVAIRAVMKMANASTKTKGQKGA